MATATDAHLGEVRRHIARLEVTSQQGSAPARSRMQQYIDGVRRAEEEARTALHRRAAAVDESFENLHNELELAEHRVAAEFATTADGFRDAVEAELHRWDVVLDRMQAQAAARTPPARERAEAAIADLRQRRLAISEGLTDVRMAADSDWLDTKTRVVLQLDELKDRTDAASLRRGEDT